MTRKSVFTLLSTRTPVLVAITLCLALLGYWAEAPLWLPYALAILAGSLALILMAARERRDPPLNEDELDAGTDRSWIARELAGKGSAPGSYLLAFFGLVTITLTGFHGPYALPAWAGLALGVAWGIANPRCSTGEELE